MLKEGVVLRAVREDAGLSLGALAKRIYFHKSYLCNIEKGKRRATPAVIRAYVDVFGDDVNRRQMLMALAVGASSPSLVREAFQAVLDAPDMTVDDWLAKLDGYAHEYIVHNPADLPPRLAEDLTQLQTRLDSPVLAGVASRLLTLYGLSLQNTSTDRRDEVLHWYQLGVAAADKSGERDIQVWARGRAALALAYEGTALEHARGFATEARALGSESSSGQLSGLLGLAHVQALDGDRAGAFATLTEARRVFEKVGVDKQVDDFSMPEWRVELIASMLGARLGDERLTLDAQEKVRKALPEAVFRLSTYMELHQALMMVRCGDRENGLVLAEDAMARHHTESTFPMLLMGEIRA